MGAPAGIYRPVHPQQQSGGLALYQLLPGKIGLLQGIAVPGYITLIVHSGEDQPTGIAYIQGGKECLYRSQCRLKQVGFIETPDGNEQPLPPAAVAEGRQTQLIFPSP